jgi:antitoxin CcdA
MAKDRANVTVDSSLLREAKAMGINLSETLETSLRAKVKEEAARRWYEENRSALESFGSYVEEHGTFGERLLASERGLTVEELRTEADRRRLESDRRARTQS